LGRLRKDGDGEIVQAVTRALSLLEILANESAPVSISELAKKANLKLTTVHRLLYTMMYRGFIEQEPVTQRYRLGLKAFEIGNAALASLDLRSIAHPYLKKLAEEVNETTNLAILDGAEVVYIDQVESTNIVIVKMFARVGSRGPAYCTGTGKVLLAGLDLEDVRRRMANVKFVKFTEQTITDIDRLIDVLKQIKQNGYALDFSERDDGVTCVAAPIMNYEGRWQAAISVSGPVQRMTSERISQEILPVLLEATYKISKRLGYQGVQQFVPVPNNIG
jgi:DNA-binding IclR family transcriptional regulator